VHVRIAREAEASVVSELMAAFRDWLGYREPDNDAIRGVVDELIQDPNTDYLLGAVEDSPVGVCQLRYRLCVWTGAPDCWLEDLFVREEARGSGLGRALVDAALERAAARGCRRIDLDVNEQNPDALAFYERMGFDLEPKGPGRTFYVARRLDSTIS
jgi:ribosomal protein S18 acetylase RimI-like enzyme